MPIKLEENDYIELLLRELVKSKAVYDRAKALRVTGDDFILDDMFGVQLYKEFVDTIFEIGLCPLDMQLFCAHINRKFEDNQIPSMQFDDALQLIDAMYTGEPSPLYFLDTLKDFVKKRRSAKITYENKGDPDLMFNNMQALMVDLHVDDYVNQAVNVHPFAAPIFKHTIALTRTGLDELDEKIMGLGYGEFAIIVGFSGGGKTVLGCNIVANNAMLGIPATFMSLEADEVEISQRLYSRFFEIPYGALHKGEANPQLEAMFQDETLATRRETMAKNLHVAGLKGLSPMTPDQLFQVLLRKYETEGFIPKVVVVDQLQFIEPRNPKKNSAPWELEKMAAAELDEMSHKTIGGHRFALWVLHQAKGKLRRTFTRDDIDGFKGIIHKCDLVMGIGRDEEQLDEASIFAMKVRHCGMFHLDFATEFGFMKFGSRIAKAQTTTKEPRRPRATRNPIREAPIVAPELPDELPRPPEVVSA